MAAVTSVVSTTTTVAIRKTVVTTRTAHGVASQRMRRKGGTGRT